MSCNFSYLQITALKNLDLNIRRAKLAAKGASNTFYITEAGSCMGRSKVIWRLVILSLSLQYLFCDSQKQALKSDRQPLPPVPSMPRSLTASRSAEPSVCPPDSQVEQS